MKKKLVLVLCSAMMAMSLVACGGSDKPEEKPQEATKQTMKDGTYEVDTKDDKDGGAKVSITVKDGKITEAKYNEFTKEGNKRENKEYNPQMKEVAKTSPETFEVEFEKQVVAAQNHEIDGVTGATGSTAQAKQLFKKAIENAEAGKTDKETIEIKK